MTRVFDDAADFRDDAIAGFAAAYARYVEPVPGATGFVRAGGPRADRVSLVVGGGSGHYPSYGGIVGRGLATGCVLGDVFASPSAEQIVRVARAAHGGRGLVLAFGNYAGDRLNFGAAQERLLAEGIDTRIVTVTDDIASAAPAEAHLRRGIAGTFAVYKAGGAAADRGDDLDTVERLMRAANAATFSFGVAFAGCTLPGRAEPLFAVDPGLMEFGLGIHGEPGISSESWMPAKSLARRLVDALLGERPANADGRAAVIVNGLGATKYEELFGLYGHVHRLLAEAGVQAVLPEVGELVTSLDMAGCSLSLTWLDDELLELWRAPADAVAFRRGELAAEAARPRASERVVEAEASAPVEVSKPVAAAADVVRTVLDAMRDAVVASEDELGRLDAVAGDGDHGAGMVRGFRAACTAARDARGGPGPVLDAAGAAFADRSGGTSGMLWGELLQAAGAALGEEVPTARGVVAAASAAATAVQSAGKAHLGDKTMLDALMPFVIRLTAEVDAGTVLAAAWREAADAALTAADETAALRPRVGRARPLADRSVGSPDPGAVSLAIVVAAAEQALIEAPCQH